MAQKKNGTAPKRNGTRPKRNGNGKRKAAAKPKAEVEKRGDPALNGGDVRYEDPFRQEVMHAWAHEGLTIQDCAERFKVRWHTVKRWRDEKSPTDWDEYKATVIAERNAIAIQVVSSQFAEVVKTQLESSKSLQQIAMAVLGGVAKKLRKMSGVDGEGEIVFDKSTTAMMREARHALDSVQRMQLAVFGVPNVRIDTDPAAKTPYEMLASGKSVDQMTDAELTSMILSFTGSQPDPPV